MTDKIMEARREMFQAWWCDDAQEELRKSCAQGWGEFIWNAAIDSLCVELPIPPDPRSGGGDFNYGRTSAIEDCREAIHAAGVKTK